VLDHHHHTQHSTHNFPITYALLQSLFTTFRKCFRFFFASFQMFEYNQSRSGVFLWGSPVNTPLSSLSLFSSVYCIVLFLLRNFFGGFHFLSTSSFYFGITLIFGFIFYFYFLHHCVVWLNVLPTLVLILFVILFLFSPTHLTLNPNIPIRLIHPISSPAVDSLWSLSLSLSHTHSLSLSDFHSWIVCFIFAFRVARLLFSFPLLRWPGTLSPSIHDWIWPCTQLFRCFGSA
jgi:hypothetical protein